MFNPIRFLSGDGITLKLIPEWGVTYEKQVMVDKFLAMIASTLNSLRNSSKRYVLSLVGVLVPAPKPEYLLKIRLLHIE